MRRDRSIAVAKTHNRQSEAADFDTCVRKCGNLGKARRPVTKALRLSSPVGAHPKGTTAMVYDHGQLGQSSRDVVNLIELRLVGPNIEDKTAPRHRCRPCAEGVASQEAVRRWTRVRPPEIGRAHV